MDGKIETLCRRVLKRITPPASEHKKELTLAQSIMERIRNTEGRHVEVVLVGSLARNTHLKGDRDIDIFVLFPEQLGREEFVREGLRIGKAVFRGHEWEKAYSEHPYIRGILQGYDVEIVPSYKVAKAELLKSSVDRSVFHNEYLSKKLDNAKRSEIRLLRQFLKGIGCYGAELKVSSVPGYVVELLILKHETFKRTLRAIASWRRREVIDLEGYYKEAEALKKFDSPLMVIDPVDRNRNVAAALSLTQYSRMIAAARAFLERPSMAFFFGRREKPWSVGKVRNLLKKKELVAVELAYPAKALPDIIWGQLHRFGRKLANQLELAGFGVLRSEQWTDENEHMVVVLELESLILQRTEKRTGPEVADWASSKRFLAAHRKLIAGPRIEQGRWVIEVERKHVDAQSFLLDFLKKAKKNEKENMRRALNRKARVLDERGILGLYRKGETFRKFLTNYLKGKESFGSMP